MTHEIQTPQELRTIVGDDNFIVTANQHIPHNTYCYTARNFKGVGVGGYVFNPSIPDEWKYRASKGVWLAAVDLINSERKCYKVENEKQLNSLLEHLYAEGYNWKSGGKGFRPSVTGSFYIHTYKQDKMIKYNHSNSGKPITPLPEIVSNSHPHQKIIEAWVKDPSQKLWCRLAGDDSGKWRLSHNTLTHMSWDPILEYLIQEDNPNIPKVSKYIKVELAGRMAVRTLEVLNPEWLLSVSKPEFFPVYYLDLKTSRTGCKNGAKILCKEDMEGALWSDQDVFKNLGIDRNPAYCVITVAPLVVQNLSK